eukprot:g12798.t1
MKSNTNVGGGGGGGGQRVGTSFLAQGRAKKAKKRLEMKKRACLSCSGNGDAAEVHTGIGDVLLNQEGQANGSTPADGRAIVGGPAPGGGEPAVVAPAPAGSDLHPISDTQLAAMKLPPREPLKPEHRALCLPECAAGTAKKTWKASPKALKKGTGAFYGGLKKVGSEFFGGGIKFRGKTVTFESAVDNWAFSLLQEAGSIFGPHVKDTEVPYVALNGPPGTAKAIAISQRQLAFIVANVVFGNDVAPGNGLGANWAHCMKGNEETAIFRSVLAFLGVLSVELETDTSNPTGSKQGATVIGARPVAPGADVSKGREDFKLIPNVRVCRVVGTPDEKKPTSDNNGVKTTCELSTGAGAAGTVDPETATLEETGKTVLNVFEPEGDNMQGNTPYESINDIAGAVVAGGGGRLCTIQNSQDESMVQFFVETVMMSFFAYDGVQSMIGVPFTLLGSRRYLNSLYGNCLNNIHCGVQIDKQLNDKIMARTAKVKVGEKIVHVYASAFVAVASGASGQPVTAPPGAANQNNRNPTQRGHFDVDTRNFVQGYDPGGYLTEVQLAVATLNRRIGVGPWGAGVWWGSSTMSFLAVYTAVSVLPQRPDLHYYVYDRYCENPGVQCLVLMTDECNECLNGSDPKTQARAGPVSADYCQKTMGVRELVKKLSAGGSSVKVTDVYQFLKNDLGTDMGKSEFDLLAAKVGR